MREVLKKLKTCIYVFLIHVLNRLPIQKNKVFLFSYYGTQYGCNPKYITEYVLKEYPKGKFDIVWAFNDTKSRQHMTGIRKVRTMSLRYFYELCTSKVVITNFRMTDLFIKRKGQYYIQTWHSSLRLKQIEGDAEETLPKHYVEMAKKDSLKCDLLLSGCQYSTDILRRAFWYDGEIFEHGTPRNDVLFQKNLSVKQKVLKSLNLSTDFKIFLYAPTFRKDNNLEVYNLNYENLLHALKERFGGEWVCLVKLHPHLIAKSGKLVYGKKVVDVTTYDDIQELLGASDILISDYSSLMFDFSFTRRPCFLYVPDVMEYTNNDRKLYFSLNELPFISAVNNEELIEKIQFFNHEAYANKLTEFFESIGSFEKGNACENLLKHIEKVCFDKKEMEV